MADIVGTLLDQGGAMRNVMDPAFGVVGDGVADETVALRNVIQAAGARA